jgi:hypothetical protein
LAIQKRGWCLGKKQLTAVAAFSFLVLGNCPASQAQCTSLKSGEKLWVRLIEPLSSYSGKTGGQIHAMVIESPKCDGAPAIPVGSVVEGQILSVRRVGMGLVHETASMRVNFRTLRIGDGNEIAIAARVTEIDNARETVKDGTIRGVNATDTPQGRITSRLKHLPTWNPYSDLTLLTYRTMFPVFPEPEIFLPRGSDVKLELTADVALPASAEPHAESDSAEETRKPVIRMSATELPERTTTSYGQAADIVNVALLGSEEQMDAAFRAAGWRNGDPTSTRSVLRQAHAFFSFNNYPSAPISKQLMDGQAADTTWEKGLNSYEKREHLRLWGRDDVIEGQTAWLGAMTRETGATLSVWRHKFIHHIDANMDDGRAMLVRDLNLAGCVAAVSYVQRPQMIRAAINATGDPMRTDGSLAVVQLKDCENPVFERKSDEPAVQARPHSKLARYLRMQVLSFKSDVVRGNIVYGAFDLTRMAIRARRQRAERVAMARRAETEHAAPATVASNALNESEFSKNK